VDSRVAFTLRADGGRSALPAAIEEAIFRIGQEAITNAVRHARAHRVEVELAIGHQGVRLAVRDDGIGFDPDAEHAGFGLSGLRERAAGMGGRLEIGSRPGEGTVVVLTVPA
jgi:signal transduction histidine kinase